MSAKVWGVIVLIIIIAAGAYFIVDKGGSAQPGTTSTSTTTASSDQSLSALVASGQNVECTFSTTTTDGTEQGTIYVSGGKVAGDFSVNNPQTNQPMQAHMIMMDSTNYVWTSASDQGFKSTVSAAATTSSANQGVSYTQPMNYSCSPWTPDQAKFSLPANVSFTATASYSAPSQGAGATGAGAGATTGTSAECSACNQLSGSQKAQCLAALHC